LLRFARNDELRGLNPYGKPKFAGIRQIARNSEFA
jgi:hypothetical protein